MVEQRHDLTVSANFFLLIVLQKIAVEAALNYLVENLPQNRQK
jgi:hypothetical protein